jgi:pyruvate formate lyase activating enzyme
MIKIHSVESLGTFDGPGIRLVLFLQGCNFKCWYCANPDTIDLKGGTLMTVEEIVQKARNQNAFFGKLGGVTVSGGEPLLQAKALIDLFKALKAEGFNTCIDTNGSVLNHWVEELMNYTDIVLLDVKHIDDAQHQLLTGQSNKSTLKMAQYLNSINKRTWLRYVLVPGYSDKPEHMHLLGQQLKGFTNIEKLEIQPYHTLGKHKYDHLNWKYNLEGVPQNTTEQLDFAKAIFDEYFDEVVVN